MADLSCSYLGLELKNPIIVSSCGYTGNIESLKKIDELGAGAVVLKSIFEEQISIELGNTKDISLIPEDFVKFMKNYSGNNSTSNYLRLLEGSKKDIKIPVFASVNCVKAGDWLSFLNDIESAGADGVELNIFFLPDDNDFRSDDFEKIFLDLVTKATHKVKIPISIKLPQLFTNPLNIIDQLFYRGVVGVTLFNRYYQPDIDLDEMELIPGDILTHKNDSFDTLRWIGLASSRVKKISFAASSGVHDSDTVIKLLLFGADAVMVCSVLYRNGLDYLKVMIDELSLWMDNKGFDKIDHIRGQMNYNDLINTFYFEREQLLRSFDQLFK